MISTSCHALRDSALELQADLIGVICHSHEKMVE